MLKLQAIGNIGKDAEVKDLNNRKIIVFSLAENDKRKDKDGNSIVKTTWIKCVIWKDQNQSTDFAKYLTKGTLLHVEGRPNVNVYTNKAGEAVGEQVLNVTNFDFLGSKKDPQAKQETKPQEQPKLEDMEADDLPF
jgi:single-strand DNA-binding protein